MKETEYLKMSASEYLAIMKGQLPEIRYKEELFDNELLDKYLLFLDPEDKAVVAKDTMSLTENYFYRIIDWKSIKTWKEKFEPIEKIQKEAAEFHEYWKDVYECEHCGTFQPPVKQYTNEDGSITKLCIDCRNYQTKAYGFPCESCGSLQPPMKYHFYKDGSGKILLCYHCRERLKK